MILPPVGNDSWWHSSAQSVNFPSLANDLDVDVLVLGGGIAGVSTLWYLLEQGLEGADVALLEAHTIAGRASGRNAGFLLTDLAEPYERLRDFMGEKACRLRNLSLRNQDTLERLGRDLAIDWKFEKDGVLIVGASDAEEAEYQKSATALKADGFDVDFVSPKRVSELLGAPNQWGGLWDPAGGGGNPAAMTRGLAQACSERGARIFESTAALEIFADGDGVAVRTASGIVRAARLVLALNAYAPMLDPSLSEMISPFRGQMLTFPPTGKKVITPIVYRNHGFEYFRQDRAGRFLFGGFRQTAIAEETGFEEDVNPDVQASLEEFARSLYPQLENVEPDSRWAGTMGFSNDGMPFVGPHPGMNGVLLCMGFTGHGFGLATECARICAELVVEGRSADADLFSTHR